MSMPETNSYVLCPYCEQAYEEKVEESRFSCPLCGREWRAMHPRVRSAYSVALHELDIFLHAPNGEQWLLPKRPTVVGRDSSFLTLQRDLSVSRRHCEISEDPSRGNLMVSPLSENASTRLNGKHLREGESYPLHLNDSLMISGILLRPEARLRQEDSLLPAEDEASLSELHIQGEGLMYVLRGDDKRLCLSSQYQGNALLALQKIEGGRELRVLALRRSSVRMNGSVFVERNLGDGELLNIEGGIFTYSATRSELLPTLGARGVDIDVKHVQAKYDQHVVLKDISCYIPANRLTAILGQSGCGKSTLIKILSGLKQAEKGAIEVRGSTRNYAEWAQECQALVPQFSVIHPELTVQQCVAYAADLCLRDANPSFRESQVARALKETDLVSKCGDRANELSGGQLKRLNIAVETVGNPSFLILDEPTTGLDYATEKQIVAVLRQMSRQGRTVLFVTHSLAVLEAVDHVIFLRKGDGGSSVVAEGSPNDVLQEIGVESWKELFLHMDSASQSSVQPAPIRKFAFMPTLLSRYVSQWLSAPLASGFLFFLLPLFLGLMICAAVAYDQKDTLLFALVGMFWLGMNQTVREIIREKDIFLHERSQHVSTGEYLFSKCIFFGALTLPQAIMMLLPLSMLDFNGTGDFLMPGRLTVGACLLPMMWLAGAVGCALGLVGSSAVMFLRSKEEVAAVLFAVLCTLPQILFSSKVIPDGLVNAARPEQYYQWIVSHGDSAPVAEFCSFFTVSRYLYLPLETIVNQMPMEIVAASFAFNVGVLLAFLAFLVFLAYSLLEVYNDRARR